MFSFDKSDLVQRLGRVPSLARVAFAAACASRMRAPYRQALGMVTVESPGALDEALEGLWAYVVGGPSMDWAAWADRLVKQIPPEEEMASPACQVLDDALAAAAYAARTAMTFQAVEAAFTANRVYDAVDAVAQRSRSFATYTPEIEGVLLRDPVVQQELGRQARDLAELEASDTASAIAAVSARAHVETAF